LGWITEGRGWIAQVVFARGHWKAPVWQGRFANMAQAGNSDDTLLVTWFLLEKVQPPGQATNLASNTEGVPPAWQRQAFIFSWFFFGRRPVFAIAPCQHALP